MSIESDESISGEVLMADMTRAGREDEFFSIDPGADLEGQLTDVVNRCRHLPLHLHFPIQWMNECLSKADLKDMRQHGQGLPSLCDTMVRFYQVNSQLFLSFHFLSISFCFLTPVFLLLTAHGSHE